MSNILDSIYNIRLLDDMARQKSLIHSLNPIAKLITTLVYLIIVVSFDKYDVINLFPLLIYPVLIFALSDLPFGAVAKKILVILPFIIGIGILNPIFDTRPVLFGYFHITNGWLTFFSIFFKSMLTVTASILLIATTGMDRLGFALRKLKVPKIFVLQLLLTYRYISVLLEEGQRMSMAYSLRAPRQKGISINVWGSFAGQLLLRTFDRAQRLYQSMNLRGFEGEYNTGDAFDSNELNWSKERESKFLFTKKRVLNLLFILGWIIFFVFARIYNIPLLIGRLIT